MAAVAVASEPETDLAVGPPPDNSARRHAVQALVIFLGIAVILQYLSIPVANDAIAKLVAVAPQVAGMDTHTQWDRYLHQPTVPDVLFMGDSQVFLNVDPSAIASIASGASSRSLRVGKIGMAAAGPEVMDALMYRLTTRPQRPRLIVFELQRFEFNSHWHWDPTTDLWQLSDPFDPGYLRLAYRVDPNRGRLLRAWIAPYFITYAPIGALAQCFVAGYSRIAVVGLTRHAPLELRGPSDCESGQAIVNLHGAQVDDSSYEFSQGRADMVREAVAMARNASVKVIFVEYPRLDTGGPNAVGNQVFQREARSLASSLNVPLYDLSLAIGLRQDFWFDDSHMTPAGARALAPKLAPIIAGQ